MSSCPNQSRESEEKETEVLLGCFDVELLWLEAQMLQAVHVPPQNRRWTEGETGRWQLRIRLKPDGGRGPAELSRRFDSALHISALLRPYPGFAPQGHKNSHKTML
jgi:hypothetical protein